MKQFCPHCGYDLVLDAPIILNDFAMIGQLAPLTYLGNPIRLTGAERALCWTLMKACPNPVRIDVILERLGSEATSNKIIEVYICRIRQKFRELGVPDMFQATSHHSGRAYAWVL